MTTRPPVARDLRTAFLAFAALALACETGGKGQAATSAEVDVSADTKASLTANKAKSSESAEARVEAQAVPGKAQLDVAAAQLAEANARLNGIAKAGGSVEGSAQPGNPSLKVDKGNAVVDAKVQAGNPSLNIGKAGGLVDANVQAGKPSLNIGGLGLQPPASTSASAGTQAKTSKTSASAGAKAKVSLGIGK